VAPIRPAPSRQATSARASPTSAAITICSEKKDSTKVATGPTAGLCGSSTPTTTTATTAVQTMVTAVRARLLEIRALFGAEFRSVTPRSSPRSLAQTKFEARDFSARPAGAARGVDQEPGGSTGRFANRPYSMETSYAFCAWRRRNVGTSRSSAGTSLRTSATLRATCCTTFVCCGAMFPAVGCSREAFHVFGK